MATLRVFRKSFHWDFAGISQTAQGYKPGATGSSVGRGNSSSAPACPRLEKARLFAGDGKEKPIGGSYNKEAES